MIEAVGIQDIEKVVLIKGLGRPLHIATVTVKAGEFDDQEVVFNCNK